MDGQYTSSGFQLYGQPLQPTGVQQSGQGLTQGATAQQVGGYAFIPAAGGGQPTLANLRPQAVQILQQPTATPQTKQQPQSGMGQVGFQTQPTQNQQQQPQQPPQQQRIQAAQVRLWVQGRQQQACPMQMPALTNQQLQYFQAAQQQGGQLATSQFQAYSQAPQQPQLGAIQILQPKTQQGSVVGRSFPQGQSTMQGMQVLPQQAQAQAQPQPQQAQASPQPIQTGQSIQGMQGLLQVPGLQPNPGVQVLQQYPTFASQVGNTTQQPKQGAVTGSGFSSASHQQSVGGTGGPGTGGVHHTGSLFSNSNQRGAYGQGRYTWSERDRNERTDFRGRPRDRARRDERGSFGSRMPAREPPARMSREREPFRHDRSNRERYDRGGNFRDGNRREKDFGKERERKPSPVHHHYDFKKEDVRKEPRREMPAKSVDLAPAKDFKTAPQQFPLIPKPPPVADYLVKVPQAPFATYERDYSDVARRYTHLHISPDFTKLICCWAKQPTTKRYPYGCSLCPLNVPIKFETMQGPHEPDTEIVLPASKNENKTCIRWNAKCTFVCGLDEKTYADVIKGKFEGGGHLMNTLKFVTIREEKERKRTGIMCLGGPYDPELDGGDPEQDMEGLKQACVRHVKAQTLLDLTPCTSWIRFCDIHYDRRDLDGHQCEEVTVIFLVDVSAIFPAEEDWPAVWREQKEWKLKTTQAEIIQMTTPISNAETQQEKETQVAEKEAAADSIKPEEVQTALSVEESDDKDEKMEDVPKEMSLLMKCRSAKNGRVKTMSISLDGLLDYDEGDRDEGTFELSLLAEGFNEMLMRDYGLLILNALMEQKRNTTTTATAAVTTDQKIDDKKRPIPILNHEVPEPLVKKPRQTDTPMATEEPTPEETPKEDETAPEAAAEDIEMPSQESPGDIVHVGDIEQQQQQPEVIMQDVTPEPTATVSPEEVKEDDDDNDAVAAADDDNKDDADADAAEGVEMKDVIVTESNAPKLVVDEELLFAFRYFDRAGCGYIKCDDLRRLLHNLGCCLAPRMVRELVHGAAAMNKEKHDRVCYRSLTDKESPANN